MSLFLPWYVFETQTAYQIKGQEPHAINSRNNTGTTRTILSVQKKYSGSDRDRERFIAEHIVMLANDHYRATSEIKRLRDALIIPTCGGGGASPFVIGDGGGVGPHSLLSRLLGSK